VCPDVLIVESTYGVQIHEPRVDRERRFVQSVYDIVHNRQGHCLIPVFALGRAQELLLILDEFWQAHPELQHVPIYFASSLGKKAMTVYQTYVNMMNAHIRDRFAISNPFVFQHIKSVKTVDVFEHMMGPCVVMASPGMLQSGLSRELFEMWCEDQRNGVILTGYCVEGTLAKLLLQEPAEVTTLSGRTVPLRMSVHYISFSAHSDYQQTSGFIDILRPPNVILVHGDKNEMQRLRSALQTRYEGQNLRVLTPKNCQTVQLPFKGELTAKAIGEIVAASSQHAALPQHGQRLQGLLVAKDFRYHLLSPNDLHTYTRLHTATLTQKLRIHVQQSLTSLQHVLAQLFDEVKLTVHHGKPALSVANAVYLVAKFASKMDASETSPTTASIAQRIPHYIVIEWVSNQNNDIIADSVVALLALLTGSTPNSQSDAFLNVTTAPEKATHQNETKIKVEPMEMDAYPSKSNTIEQETKSMVHTMKDDTIESNPPGRSPIFSPQLAHQIHSLLTAYFGPVSCPQPHIFLLNVDGARATIDFERHIVASNDANLRQRILSIVTMVHNAIFPVTLDESKSHFLEAPLANVAPDNPALAITSQEGTETIR
jgi:cleavage and polyadenylation specificity factor subunit 3